MTAADRVKLARILGMLGSEHAGERASAALQAEAFRKRHGMTWEEMLALPAVEVVMEPVWTPPPARPPTPPPLCPPLVLQIVAIADRLVAFQGFYVDSRLKALALVVAWVGGAILVNVY
jgi:hypothetical protein